MKTFKTVARYDEISKKLNSKICDTLLCHGFTYCEDSPKYVIVIGGDGTFLDAVHSNIKNLDNTYFYGIHTGTLGFFTDYKSDELDEFLNDFLTKDEKIVEYQMIELTVDDNQTCYALNEIRIENARRTQVIEITVDDLEFETFRGTGICVCTQLGSTAYNRSIHGAIVQDGLPILEMSEIAGIHHSSYKSLGVPIILKDKSVITFKSEDFNGALLCNDAHFYDLTDEKKITVKLSDKKVKMLRYKNISYFKKVQSLF